MLNVISDQVTRSNMRVDYNSPTVASVLMATLDILEKSGIPYAVLHGYEDFPEFSASDIDICIDRAIGDREVCKLLDDNAHIIGAQVISCRNGAVLLTGETAQRRPFFLKLDLDRDFAMNGLRIISGQDVLAARQKYGSFHVPSPRHQLAGYLAKSILKGKFDLARTSRLASLYNIDPTGSTLEIARVWSVPEKTLLLQALVNNEWEPVIVAAPQLRNKLIVRLRQMDRFGQLAHVFRKLRDRVGRVLKPKGLSVVVLGPDGAGKSSLTDAIGGPNLLPVFDRSVCWGFVPPLHRLIGRNHGPSSEPHALPARSLAGSLIKAGYWLTFSILSHPRTHFMKARGGLVLYDRHFVDILVDETRYRYSGPSWLLRAIWSVIPKPDIVVLLDAPADAIHKRKNELSLEEIGRQLERYRKLVRALPNGVILDANKPLANVVEAFNSHLLSHYKNASG